MPDIGQSKSFYTEFLGLSTEQFNMGWVARFTSPLAAVDIQLVERDATAPEHPVISVLTDDIVGAYEEAIKRGYEIVHPPGELASSEGSAPPLECAGHLRILDTARGNGHHKLVCFVIRRFERHRIQSIEDNNGEPTHPLVPIDQRMIPDERLQQNSSFSVYRFVGLFAKDCSGGPMRRRVEQAKITNRADTKVAD